MPPRMRKSEMEAAYKRIKEILKMSPETTDQQITARTGIGYRKVAELRIEVEHEGRNILSNIIASDKQSDCQDHKDHA